MVARDASSILKKLQLLPHVAKKILFSQTFNSAQIQDMKSSSLTTNFVYWLASNGPMVELSNLITQSFFFITLFSDRKYRLLALLGKYIFFATLQVTKVKKQPMTFFIQFSCMWRTRLADLMWAIITNYVKVLKLSLCTFKKDKKAKILFKFFDWYFSRVMLNILRKNQIGICHVIKNLGFEFSNVLGSHKICRRKCQHK